MRSGRRIERLAIEIPREQTIRYLGMHRGGRAPKPEVRRVFEEELALAAGLVEARAVVQAFETAPPGSDFVSAGEPVALVVCTIGIALERRVHDLMAAGDVARAMMLDAIGSAAAEEAADASNHALCAEALAEGRRPDRRGSPGYGKWKLVEQRWIFSLLDPAAIGVSLTERCMMIPAKSVSFGLPLTGGERHASPDRRCVRCGMTDCAYRAV
ncbi:MAG: vitamin B12 dependent-methionine synthase activation domain-containing protein [Planctomycetota bacterium]